MDTEPREQLPPAVPGGNQEAHRVRRWLEEAWRHGEIQADDDVVVEVTVAVTDVRVRPSPTRRPLHDETRP